MSIFLGIAITIAIVLIFIVFLFLGKNKKMDPATTTQNNQVDPMDEKIKSKFKLFQGVRPVEEDQKILEKVSDMCFSEMLYFVAENLTDEQRASFESESENAENDDARLNVFTKYVSQIPNYQAQLNERMDKYLDKIVETSLNSQNI